MSEKSDLKPLFITLQQAAEITSLSVDHLRRMARAGEIEAIKTPGKRGRILIRYSSIENMGKSLAVVGVRA